MTPPNRTAPADTSRPILYAEWTAKARTLQRKGLTFTEIAELLNVPRSMVVQRLYWDIAR